jgi:hypothetical protein
MPDMPRSIPQWIAVFLAGGVLAVPTCRGLQEYALARKFMLICPGDTRERVLEVMGSPSVETTRTYTWLPTTN